MLNFMPSQLCLLMRSCITAALFLSATASLASNQQLRLQCQLFAGGEDYAFVFVPTAQPYTAKPIDLERFRFKAIVSQGSDQIGGVKLLPASQALVLSKWWEISSLLKNEGLPRRSVRDCDFDVLNLIAALADNGFEPEAL